MRHHGCAEYPGCQEHTVHSVNFRDKQPFENGGGVRFGKEGLQSEGDHHDKQKSGDARFQRPVTPALQL